MSDIQHAHLYGMREAKYDWLLTHDVNSTDWNEIEPQKPFHLFIPQNNDSLAEFQEYWKITEVMTEFSLGCLTKRDNLVIAKTFDELYRQIEKFLDNTKSDDEATKEFDLKLADQDMWNAHNARLSLSISEIENHIREESFRPFDTRFIFYHVNFVARLNRRVMQHLEPDNLALITVRQLASLPFDHIWVTDSLTDQHIISVRTKEGGVVCPLYLYPNSNNPQTSTIKEQRCPNLSDEFLKDITNKLGYTPTPEAIFYYIYAIFHSPTYRTRYAEFLKIDFPRVPLTSDDRLFRKLGEYGEELVALHLMKSEKLPPSVPPFKGGSQDSSSPPSQGGVRGGLEIFFIDNGGEFIVDAGHPKFLPSPTGRGAGGEGGEVIINKKGDRFTDVPKSVWNFYVGGYQVCHKWLKDRKGRQLSPEDLNHYQKIIVALAETMQIMKAIDAAIPSFPIE
ncbi:helicase [Pseudanabaena biceps]|nr:helicase [Pseudanabaena biceps]